LQKSAALEVAKKVGLEEHAEETAQMLLNMYDLFLKKDALLIEINPYAEDANESCKLSLSCDFIHVHQILQIAIFKWPLGPVAI
jgi:succinyl-CoA synthetase beta subunit